jgi:hypothetical protein
MSIDLQIVMPQESVLITSAQVVPGADPPTLDIIGDDFTSVDEVLINDFVCPSYHVISPTRMYATVPDQVPLIDVSKVAVTSRRLVMTPQSYLKFRVSRIPGKVTGILRLIQLFVKVLFTTAGTDIFNPQLGGNGMRPLGRNFGKQETGSILSDFVICVDNTSRQIVTIQGRQAQLPMDERLLSARVTASQFSIDEAALITTVEVTSQAGRSALANLVL